MLDFDAVSWIEALVVTFVIPLAILYLNYEVRKLTDKGGYYSSFADLLLVLLVFDLSSMVLPSTISLIIRNTEFKKVLRPILAILFMSTLIVWGKIVLSIEYEIMTSIYEAGKKAGKKAGKISTSKNLFRSTAIAWPMKSLLSVWKITFTIMACHLGLLFWP